MWVIFRNPASSGGGVTPVFMIFGPDKFQRRVSQLRVRVSFGIFTKPILLMIY